MALVVEQHQLHRHVPSGQCGDDPVRLAARHVRVVRTVHDQQRNGDPVGRVDRGQRAQQGRVGARLAVLRDGRGGHPRLGRGVERLQVGHAADVDAGPEQPGEPGQGDEREVPAVGAAADGEAVRVGEPAAHQVRGRGADVGERVLPLVAVIGPGERAPPPGGAAHVRGEHGDPRGGQPLQQRCEPRSFLGLRPAVQPDQGWSRPVGARGPQQPAGQVQAVLRGEPFRSREHRGAGRARQQRGRACRAPGSRERDPARVRGRVRAVGRHDQRRAVTGERHAGDGGGRCGQPDRTATAQVADLQPGEPAVVPHERRAPAGRVQRDQVEVRAVALGDHPGHATPPRARSATWRAGRGVRGRRRCAAAACRR